MCPGSVVTGGIIYKVGIELSFIWQTCKYFPDAELTQRPSTGSSNFPAPDNWGSLPLQQRLHSAASYSSESRLAARWLPATRPRRHTLRCSVLPAHSLDPGKCEPALRDPRDPLPDLQPLPLKELARPALRLSISCSFMLCILMYFSRTHFNIF